MQVVVVGGGSGSFNVLSGLKKHPLTITSIVSTFDSGGSTGVLRDEFGALPGGDVRRALLALAPQGKDMFLRELLQVRFDAPESSLHNHSFGNLLLLAAERTAGSRLEAIEQISTLLHIQGKVLPVSVDDSHVCVELSDGTLVEGEANIDIPKHNGALSVRRVWLAPEAKIVPAAAEALLNADWIIFGPGDLYTSILPNVLTKGFAEAIQKSSAKIVYISNIMTKWGETHNLSAEEHVEALLAYLRVERLHAVLVHTGAIPEALLEKYTHEKKSVVLYDENKLMQYADNIVKENFMGSVDIARHNPERTAEALMRIMI